MIDTLTGAAVAAAMCCACIGMGAAAIRRLGLSAELTAGETLAIAFAIGFGSLGWIVFFLAASGFLHRGFLAAILILGFVGLRALAEPPWARRDPPAAGGILFWLLIAAITASLAADLLEGLSPPTDADSLAYHFALPKQFVAAGRLEFVPRAVDGAIPLLPQMTYLVALALGGEKAMTLWTMISGWAPGFLLYALCRRHLSREWSLAAMLVLLTTPAMLYGAGAGQVEARMGTFALAAAAGAGRWQTGGRTGYAVLAGMMGGFCAASKYTGLLLLAAGVLPLLFHHDRVRGTIAYSTVALLAGFQWYLWNFIHTGDPVFPMLFLVLGMPGSDIWNAAQHAVFTETFRIVENPVPRSLLWYLTYPFQATFGDTALFESGRTGLGVGAIMLLPFAVLGAWPYRQRILASPLASVALIAFAYYTLWFFSGSSQRVRHLLPIYPHVVLCLTVAAARWTPRRDIVIPLATGVALTILVQLGGQAVYAASFARHVLTGESRDALLTRAVQLYTVVPWINAHLGPGDRIVVTERQLVYLIDPPVIMAHEVDETTIDIGPNADDPVKFWHQLRREKATHLLVRITDPPPPGREKEGSYTYQRFAAALIERGCLRVVHTEDGTFFPSRTFSARQRTVARMEVLALDPTGCRL